MNDSFNQDSLGKYLRSERESRNVSLEQVAYATRISIKMLRALEEDNHDALPAPTFVRGYLQAFAKYVRLDEQDLLLRYQHCLATTAAGRKTKLKSHYLYVKERYQEKRKVVLMVGMFFSVLLVMGLVFAFRSKHHGPRHRGTEATVATAPTPATTPAPETAKAEPAKAELAKAEPVKTESAKAEPAKAETPDASPPTGKYVLSLSATVDVWFRFQTDDGPIKDLTLRQGKTLILAGNKVIKLFSGNLGALKATLNNEPVVLLTEPGRTKSAVLPASESGNYPLPLFPPMQSTVSSASGSSSSAPQTSSDSR